MDILGFELTDECIKHILEGDFTNVRDKDVQISGGLHSYESFNNFLSKRTDFENVAARDLFSLNKYWYSLEIHHNGVFFLRLPTIAFTNKALRNTAGAERHLSSAFSSKTLFPRNFSKNDLIKLIGEVIESSHIKTNNKGDIKSSKKEQSICGVGTYKGKSIYAEVIFHDKKITTCFPTMNQTGLFKDKETFRILLDHISNMHPRLDYKEPFRELDLSNFWNDLEDNKILIEQVLKLKGIGEQWRTYDDYDSFLSSYSQDLFNHAIFCKNPYDVDFFMEDLSNNSNKYDLNHIVFFDFQRKVNLGLKGISRQELNSMIRLIRLFDISYVDYEASSTSYNFALWVGYFLHILESPDDINNCIISCLNSPILDQISGSFTVLEAVTDLLNSNLSGLNRDYLDPLMMKILRSISHDEEGENFLNFKTELKEYLMKNKDPLDLLVLLK